LPFFPPLYILIRTILKEKWYSRYGLRRCVCALARTRAMCGCNYVGVCKMTSKTSACGLFFHWSHPHMCDHFPRKTDGYSWFCH
jgi:hypothetical protein